MNFSDDTTKRRIVWGLWGLLVLVVAIRSTISVKSNNCVQTYFEAGRNWRAQADLYQRLNDTCRYTQTAHILLAPFSMLEDRWGSLVWRIFCAGIYLPALAWWGRAFFATAHDQRTPWLFMLWALPLSISSINNGQANIPVLTGLILGTTAALRRFWWTAAIGIVFAAIFKVYPISLGMLLVLICPWAFTWRLIVISIVAALLPFAVQDVEYVKLQYQAWFANLRDDDRSAWEFASGYRDLWLLIRRSDLPLPYRYYPLVQLAFAGIAAGACLVLRWRRVRYERAVLLAAGLGNTWMALCGPASEASTYTLLAPIMASIVMLYYRHEVPRWPARLAWAGIVCLLLAATSNMFPFGTRFHGFGPHPLGGLLIFIALVWWCFHAATTPPADTPVPPKD